MKIHPVGAVLFHPHRQLDGHFEANSRFLEALQMLLITFNRTVPVTDELQQMLILMTAKTCYGHKLQELSSTSHYNLIVMMVIMLLLACIRLTFRRTNV